jgi:hypothetical protein
VSPWLAAQLGYDPHRVAEMSKQAQRALALVALASIPAVGLLSVSAGYGTFLASDVLALSVAMGLGAGFYLLNLLRVAVAGGGVGPQQPVELAIRWGPRTVPLVMLALLGGFFAQPLILAALASEQDVSVDALRTDLVARHKETTLKSARAELSAAKARLTAANERLAARQKQLARRNRELASAGPSGRKTVEIALSEDKAALEQLTGEAQRATDGVLEVLRREEQLLAREIAPYERHLAQSHFLLRRLQLTWARPVRPVLLTLLMVMLMVLPWFVSATAARGASRSYESRRWVANRELIDAAYAEARKLEAQVLAQWPTFVRQRLELFEDAPYDTKPRSGAGAYEARRG